MTTNGDVVVARTNDVHLMNNNVTDRHVDAWMHIDMVTSGKLMNDDLRRAYDSMCDRYNKDLIEAQYNGPRMGAMKLAEYIPDRSARILDCACGTGMVGEEMRKLGYTNVTGADMSEKSVEVAKATGCYSGFILGNVLKAGLAIEDDSFDGIISVGTFIPGHVDQRVFPEFQRVVKPGGFIVITMRENYIHTGEKYVGGQLDSAIVRQVEENKWNYIARLRIPNFIEDYPGVVFILQVR